MSKPADFLPIEDYFVIGDLHTVALISKQGSIDWLCLPNFDSPSIFGKLLDPRGGCLAIDMPGYESEASYIENTAIIEFRLSAGGNEIAIRDFMVPHPTKKETNQQLARTIIGIRGKTKASFTFQPKCNYGSTMPSIQKTKNQLQFSCNDGALVLHLPTGASASQKAGCYQIAVPIEQGDTKQLLLEYIPKTHKLSLHQTNLEHKARDFWQRWVSKGQYADFRRSQLIRSAITLKLMQFYPTGAIVAAPTTSLPEGIGGIRNWDYRYVWVRDATFVLYALHALGHNEEAERFFTFIEKVTRQCTEGLNVSLVYTVWGEAVPEEQHLGTLSGYKSSKPVRVGNQAAHQFQLDIYGSLIDAFYFVSKRELTKANKPVWRKLVMQLVKRIDELWQEPDHGIWEARVSPRHYTYSKVMAWVGTDRANRLQETLGFTSEDKQICACLAQSIRDWIWEHSYKQERQVLTQHPETSAVDATNLLFVLLQFLDKHEPLTRKIIDETIKELARRRVFVYRYRESDGLPGEEGTFWLCSFWLISALAILEDVTGALELFQELEQYIAPSGLISEEFDTTTNRYLGNFPQAFSHTGYIMTVHYIHKYAERKNIKLDGP